MVAVKLIEKEVAVFSKERMRARRVELKLDQNQASALAKIHRNQWANYEGGFARPASETLVQIAKALDCSVDYLLGLTDETHELGSLSNDERAFLENYRARRIKLQDDMLRERNTVNQMIAVLPDETRNEVIAFITKLIEKRGGKFNNLPNKK